MPSDYVVEIALAGFSAPNAGILNTSLSSDYPFLKAYLQGSFNVTLGGDGTYTTAFTHGLGYIPVFLPYGSVDPANPTRRFMGQFAASGAHGDISSDSYATTTQLFMSWTDTTGGYFASYPYTVGFYYYIFYDQVE